MGLAQTNDLIDEIANGGNPPFNPVNTKQGRYGGTFVAKELVYAYAMWVSAKFHLAVRVQPPPPVL